MYSPRIIERSIERIEKMEGVKLKRYKIDSSVNMADDINNLYDESTKSYRRPLTKEEQDFIRNEQLMCSVDFMYWARRYMRIKTKAPGPPRLYEPWESQILLHELMADLEDTTVERQDGIMICNLKARQLGMSTVYEGALSHRAFSTCGFTGMLAADEPEQSMYLFSMMERIYDNLPQFLKPAITYHVKNEHMSFGKLDSIIFVSHGNLKADMGRGKTPHAVHLSELEKWPNTDQIDSGLLVSLPRLPTTVAFFESTGEIRGSWWHGFCEDSIEKQNRFTMFFVPWYAEPNTYIKPAPEDWTPDKVTTNHAELVERESPQWMRGKTVRLNRDQLYFWEFTRNEYARKGKTGVFFCEYASSPREAFRSANSSIFTYEIIEFLRSKSSFPNGYEVIGPGIDHDRISLAQVDHIKRKARRVDIKPQHDFETN